ncbi:toll/interleukin-1 receptor domain-containing protein [Echinicola sp. 20G]|uniref:toll/interleukin-1 receptor domain-containing protein n=1 Tax=Echinicola sp. 20G TaxID=2781961 RepID=UPI001910721B|nr:toll/interleukin-1 receptor domain-containing protein [Echinicola sp. 20G]
MSNGREKLEIYLSYAWNKESEAIADALEDELTRRGARFMRDKSELQYKGRIQDFMDQIGQGKYVILIISNDYFKSEYCMYELLKIFENKSFYERIYPIVLDEVNISDAADRVELVKYWEVKSKQLDEKIRKLEQLSNIQGITEDLNLYQAIRNNIAKLTSILKDINYLNTQKHIKSDFSQIISLIEEKHDADFGEFSVRPGIKYVGGILAALIVVCLGVWLWLGRNQAPMVERGNLGIPDSLLREVPVNDEKEGETPQNKPMVKSDEIHPEESERKAFEVNLVVPSRMSQAEVWVDGGPGVVLERNLIFIKLEVKEKKGTHRIELRGKTDTCKVDRVIKNDIEELSMCN